MKILENLKYTKTHEWVKIAGDIITVGITEFAQKEISDIVYIELPKLDKEFKSEEPCVVLESVKAAFDVYAPVSGKVTEINNEIVQHPEIVNKEPYNDGWFFKIKMKDSSEIQKLLSADEYKKLIGEK